MRETTFYLKPGTKRPNSEKIFKKIVGSGELGIEPQKDGSTVIKIVTERDIFRARETLEKMFGKEAVKEAEERLLADTASSKKRRKKKGSVSEEDLPDIEKETVLEEESA